MIEKVVRALIALALAALCVYLVIWVLGTLGFGFPPMVLNVLWVIVVLVVILYLWRLFKDDLSI